MEAFQAPLVPYLLLPHRDVRAVIAHVGIQWRERGPEHHEGRLLSLEVGLVGSARPLGRHGNDMGERERRRRGEGKEKERETETERERWGEEVREDGVAFPTALQGKRSFSLVEKVLNRMSGGGVVIGG
jgi:hypothetical protein